MKFTLKDYQSDALIDVLENLGKARRRWHDEGERNSFALTATTGAGKTVVAGAVIEALFKGDEEYDFAADPGAVVLWFSDDPSLNEQTRFRLLEACDRITHSDLVVVDNPFQAERFTPGKVYFLNTQKLGKKSRLVRGHDGNADGNGEDDPPRLSMPDLRSYTIWDTIQNTIEDDSLTLYMVLDEAHRGMGKPEADRPTIVRRLISGHGTVPPMPIVWGISATVARFAAAMSAANGAGKRANLPNVEVDAAQVQASGLLKDDIVLDIPAESGQFDTALLRRATRKIVASTKAWQDYADVQGDPEPVVPLLVLQSPNTPTAAMLTRALDTIKEEWPELPADAVAHVFGDHTTQTFGGWAVPHIAPERVQEATYVRVLLAKDAISTGWDCPRAEVLVSFRPAQDETHITQLLGRLVRTPLARRIPGDERLNSVDCILPFFDRRTATRVVKTLMNTGAEEGGGGTGGGTGRRVLIDPQEMTPNSAVEASVWACLDALPSQSLPKRIAKPVKRLTALAQALATDGLRSDAGKQAHAELHKVLDGLATRYASEVEAAVKDVEEVEGEAVRGTRGGTITYSPFSEAADDRVIDDAFHAAGRVFSPDLARTYADHLAGPDDPTADDDGLRDAHVKIAALALVLQIREALDAEADKLATKWLTGHRVAIKALSDERREVYNDIQAMSTSPQRISLARPKNRQEETKRRKDEDTDELLPTRDRHLLSDVHGNFPVGGLNDWEVEVLDKEMAFPGAVAWYRNPARASADSLAIAYKDGKGSWRTMRPDFVFFTRQSDDTITASIIDPHGIHLSDAIPKLRGLATFAAEYGSEFHRIEAVTKIGDTLRVLDVTKESVRTAIASARDAEALYRSDTATDY